MDWTALGVSLRLAAGTLAILLPLAIALGRVLAYRRFRGRSILEAVVALPLVTYLASPDKTLAVVQRLNDWISARRHAMPAVILGAVGLLLVVTGMGKI